jgi:hypothetical protein
MPANIGAWVGALPTSRLMKVPRPGQCLVASAAIGSPNLTPAAPNGAENRPFGGSAHAIARLFGPPAACQACAVRARLGDWCTSGRQRRRPNSLSSPAIGCVFAGSRRAAARRRHGVLRAPIPTCRPRRLPRRRARSARRCLGCVTALGARARAQTTISAALQPTAAAFRGPSRVCTSQCTRSRIIQLLVEAAGVEPASERDPR